MGSAGAIVGGVVGAVGGFILSGFNPAGAITGFAFGYSLGRAVFGNDFSGGISPNNQFNITTATEGSCVPIVAGKRDVTGNVIYFDHLETADIGGGGGSGAGGGKAGASGKNVFAAVHMTLAVGTLRAIGLIQDNQGRDWEQLNSDAGGSPFQISTDLGTDFGYGPFSAPLMGLTSIYSRRLFMGENARSMTPLKFRIDIQPVSPVGDPYDGLTTGVNAACVIWWWLTNTQWGARLPASGLNLTAFQASFDILKAENRGVNIYEAGGDSLENYLQKLLDQIGGILRNDGSGKLELHLLRTTNYGTPFAIGPDDMADVQVQTPTWDTVWNDFIATFPNEAFNFDQKPFPLRNEAAIAMAGGLLITKTYDFPYFTDVRNASRRLAELKDEWSFPCPLLGFKTSKRFHKVRVGEVFSVTHPAYNWTNELFRVSEVSDADFGKETMLFKCRLLREALIVNYSPPVPESQAPAPGAGLPLPLLDIGAFANPWDSHRSPPIGPPNDAIGVSVPIGPWAAGTPNALSTPLISDEYPGRALCLFPVRGGGRDVGYALETVDGQQADLPVALPGHTPGSRWAYKFTAADVIPANEYRYVHNDFPLRLTFVGFPNQTVLMPDNSDVDANGFLTQMETGRWALLIGNTEVCLFRSVVKSGNDYLFRGVYRGGNKEYLFGWPVGTPVMLVDTRDPVLRPGTAWVDWANRQRFVSQEDYDDPSLSARVRVFGQAIDIKGNIATPDRGYNGVNGKTFEKRSGIKLNASGLYPPRNEILCDRGPFPHAQAYKKGKGFDYRSWYGDAHGVGGAHDWVVEFPPFPDDRTGVGDRVAYDTTITLGQPAGPPVDAFSTWPHSPTDVGFDAQVGLTAAVNGQQYRLYVCTSINDDPFTAAVRTKDYVFVGDETEWPAILYTAAEQATDGLLTSNDLALWISVAGRSGAFCRPRLVDKIGAFPRQVDPSYQVQPS